MTARLLNFPSRRPLPKATIQASVVSSTVYNTPDGPLLEIILTTLMDDVHFMERQKLVEVLHLGQSLTVSLGGDVPIPRSRPIRKSNEEGSGGDDVA